jgi:hypothetical protein
MNKYALMIISVLFFSCKTDNSNKNGRKLGLIPEPDILMRLEGQKYKADSFLINIVTPTEYIEIDDKQKPMEVTKKDDEEIGYQTQYYIYKDTSDNVRAIVEIPFSQSGDWFLEVTHYLVLS